MPVMEQRTKQHRSNETGRLQRSRPVLSPLYPHRHHSAVLFSLMLSALLRQDYDPAAVLEIVRRTLY